MNKFIIWLAGGEQVVKETKEISRKIAEYGVDNITIHPGGGIKINLPQNNLDDNFEVIEEDKLVKAGE